MHDPRHCALRRPAEPAKLSSHHSYEDDALMLGLADLLAKNIAGDLGVGSLPSTRPIRAPLRSGGHAGALVLPRPGLVIDGKRQLTRLIGAGAFGSVFEARQLDLDRLEAIKFLHERWMADAYPDVRTRFWEEARVMAKMRSPHMAEIYDWGALPGGLPFFVMERLVGKTLRARLREQADLSLEELFDVAAALLEGLAHAHAHGVVHCDVKPENIFLTAHGAKLIDFGLAGSSTQPASGEGAMGTPLYMAPELLSGSACPNARTDVYGAAVVMYEMLRGSVPFRRPGLDRVALAQAPACERPLPLDTHRAGAPPELDALIASGLAKEAHERPPTARAMLARLQEIREHWASTASNPHERETS